MYVLDASRAHIRLRCVTDWATERSLLAGQRPLLVSSRLEDPEQELQFTEGNIAGSSRRGGRAESQ